ncbi:aminoacyl-tRNA hydrolase [Brockia lithotrophica]|uniref:Peptidyl-tRNA hydrolase n=1 Tax=Brockia lithotrophica TaxID=933949 RepID=A0A660KWA6_9BACL|nr:aminoacyl-tRNA hydrolase [Brockia lithotrophica]RKQ85631.1 peptidyl-tRNA hydrolase [Brockia lithotrophica]
MRLIVGLGNPGKAYEATRHNVGFWVIDALAGALRLRGFRWRDAYVYEADVDGERRVFLKPLTYMNLSGKAVRAAAEAYKIPPGEVLVVLDDLALPLGRLRLRPRGSSGGHRGLASVLEALGTEEVPRLRVGIGSPPPGVDAADFVLSPFLPEEEETIAAAVEAARDAVLALFREPFAQVMTRVNAR